MKNELEAVDHFVKVTINPTQFTEAIPSTELQKSIDFIDGEHSRICNCILTEVYELNLSQRAEPYIQFHQTALADLIDRLQRYTGSTTHRDLIDFYGKVSAILGNIISYIQEYLNKYMDHDLPIPHLYNQLLKDDLAKSCKVIDTRFKDTDVPSELVEIALRPLRTFLKAPQKISFRKAIYLQEIVRDLVELSSLSGNEKNTRFHELMFRINFNAPDYVYYCTAALDRKLNELESHQAKLEMLDHYVKIIRRQPIKNNLSLVPNFQPVWEQMLIWIREEYQYLLAHNIPEANSSNKINKIKIKTSFSVPQLAAFARAMIEKGAITNTTNIEVLRFFAQYVTTLNADDISEESLKNKFYNIEPGTKGQMKEWFTGFLQVLDEL